MLYQRRVLSGHHAASGRLLFMSLSFTTPLDKRHSLFIMGRIHNDRTTNTLTIGTVLSKRRHVYIN